MQDSWNEEPTDNDEAYTLNGQDWLIVHAAMDLLTKVLRSSETGPRQCAPWQMSCMF